MKRIDYFWARLFLDITSIVFLTQVIFELFGVDTRKPGFEWVLQACGAAFAVSVLYALALVLINAYRDMRG